MVLQLEDFVKILKALHCGIDFVFLFGHSFGHDVGRKDRFTVMNMYSGYGGAQQEVHPKHIQQGFWLPWPA